MAKEWVDHSLKVARDAKTKLEATERADVDMDKKLKETFAQLAEVEKAHRNAKSTLRAMRNRRLMPWKPRGRPKIKWP